MAKPKRDSFGNLRIAIPIADDQAWEQKHAKPEPKIDPAMRARVNVLFKNLARSMAPPSAHKHAQMAQEAPKGIMDYSDSPCPLSPALRASLGLGEA